MDDPSPLRDLLAKNQENLAGAAILSLAWSVCYSVAKRLALRDMLMAGAVGSLLSATLWLFLASYLNVALFILFPVAIGCGVGAFPLLRAYTKKDDAFADGMVDASGGVILRFLKRFGAKP